MSEPHPAITTPARRGLRWWPAVLILVGTLVAVAVIRLRDDLPFQQRNINTAQTSFVAFALLLLWWTLLSRAPKRLRLGMTAGVLALIVLVVALFRIRGVSGDLVPILEPRWAKRVLPAPQSNASPASAFQGFNNSMQTDFPQSLGPDRTGVLPGPKLATDWSSSPPKILWRQKIGGAWSGFSIAGGRAFTQEQRGEDECVTCYELATGRLLWSHADKTRYATTIAGEGPRATPTVVGGRLFTLGATGFLNCLDAATGKGVWSRNLATDAHAKIPEWGLVGSPLLVDDRVIVSAGGSANKSLLAYRADDGQFAWSGGSGEANYGSPFVATLAGVRQILVFNTLVITSHDAATGAVLWEHRWTSANPSAAVPVVVDGTRVVFSSGYGFGSDLLEIRRKPNGKLAATRVWHSTRMKSKFAHIFARDGFLYGLDDGIFACVDLKDGSLRWKEGRYGHGQGLLVGELYLLMAESGELVLLRPTPDAPQELARFRVFNAKTWNPIALSGDLLLVRNDQEAACLRLPLAK
ncbi:MAG TPA: PQQ-binding-like beta-propeller repeat protein [Verrucomicrobiae bacterium]